MQRRHDRRAAGYLPARASRRYGILTLTGATRMLVMPMTRNSTVTRAPASTSPISSPLISPPTVSGDRMAGEKASACAAQVLKMCRRGSREVSDNLNAQRCRFAADRLYTFYRQVNRTGRDHDDYVHFRPEFDVVTRFAQCLPDGKIAVLFGHRILKQVERIGRRFHAEIKRAHGPVKIVPAIGVRVIRSQGDIKTRITGRKRHIVASGRRIVQESQHGAAAIAVQDIPGRGRKPEYDLARQRGAEIFTDIGRAQRKHIGDLAALPRR